MRDIVKRLLLSLLSISYFSCPKDGVIRNRYNYSVVLFYESNLLNNTCSQSVIVNGKQLRCVCGGDPMVIIILYGNIQAYCIKHMNYLATGSNLMGYNYEQ